MSREELFRPIATMPADPARGPTPYSLLIRQSRKLGSAATKTFNLTRSLLTAAAPTRQQAPTHPDAILFGPRAPGQTAPKQTVKSLLRQSHQVLASATTVILPNNLFPDTVIVDRTKVTIIKRFFFWTSQTINVRIEDILNVSVSVGPLFGSLTISSRVMNSTDHYETSYFWRGDAIHLKRIIQGYVIALHNDTDINDLKHQELVDTLVELGRD